MLLSSTPRSQPEDNMKRDRIIPGILCRPMLRKLLCAMLLLSCSSAALSRQVGSSTPQVLPEGAEFFPESIAAFNLTTHAARSPLIGQWVNYAIGGSLIIRNKVERSDSGDSWSQPMTSTEPAGFIITSLCFADGGDTLFVAGIRNGGAAVIQRWAYSPRVDGWQVRYPLPAGIDQLGIPAPQAAPTISLFGAGPWAPVTSADETLPPAVRSTVYSKTGAVIYGLSADPQGRYLIAFDMNAQETLQIDLTQSPVVSTVIADITTQPQMDIAGYIKVADYLGTRAFVFQKMMGQSTYYDQVWTVAFDLDNDGLAESWSSFNEDEWRASPYSDWSLWDVFDGK